VSRGSERKREARDEDDVSQEEDSEEGTREVKVRVFLQQTLASREGTT